MKLSLICTTLNEAKTIEPFFNSFLKQTKLPDELIVCDGGSTDNTLNLLKNLKAKPKIIILQKKGNRSIGRNEAIKQASGEIILCTDLGCALDKNWVAEITKPLLDKNVDVVAGFYKSQPKTVFEKCIVPYVLVMPDKVNPANFLPATRSMAFKKSTWEKIGGFNEKLSHNEDYDFAVKLKKKKYKIIFTDKAIVYWKPRNNLKQTFIMFFRFAYGDAEAKIFRPKVLFLFARYLSISILFIYSLISGNNLYYLIILLLFIFYLVWSVLKNFNYVKHWQAIFILPLIQFTADFSVMMGTLMGILNLPLRTPHIKV